MVGPHRAELKLQVVLSHDAADGMMLFHGRRRLVLCCLLCCAVSWTCVSLLSVACISSFLSVSSRHHHDLTIPLITLLLDYSAIFSFYVFFDLFYTSSSILLT